MRATTAALAMAGVLCLAPGMVTAQEPERPALSTETTLGELLSAAASELRATLLYDGDLAGRRVALAGSPRGASARVLLEEALRLHGMHLDLDDAARVGRVASGLRRPDEAAALGRPRVVHTRYADPHQVAGVLRGYLQGQARAGEWVHAIRGTSDAVVLSVRPELLGTLEAVITDLDRPAASGETAEVVRVAHGRAREIAVMLARLCTVEREVPLRAEAGPDGASIALVGHAARIAQAKALLAGLDVPVREK